MIFLLETAVGTEPLAWFAFDGDDLRRKLAARGGPPDGDLRIWPDEASAVLAFEDDADPAWQGAGWKARIALREQLIATEVLSDG